MGRALCFSLALLFLANVIPSKAQKAAAEAAEVTVAEGAPLALECRLRPEQRAEWRRDGGALPADLRAEPERPAPDGRLAARLLAARARPAHAGLYTCSAERDQRVRLLVRPAPAAPAAPAAGESTTEAEAAAGAEAGARAGAELLFDVRGNFSLHCSLPNDNNLEYIWKKNETAVEQLWDLRGRYTLERARAEFRVARAAEDDFGNYSCALAAGGEQRWAVRARPHVKLPPNTNVVEGQKLKLVCKMIGKPYARVSWWYSNSTEEDENFTSVAEALGGRALLAASEQGVPDGALVLEAAARADAGRYRCTAEHAPLPATTQLRVKDMYAALWPFLGICAEVFILCAVILVYEKRRAKPDLDDSDTDNHDQKKS